MPARVHATGPSRPWARTGSSPRLGKEVRRGSSDEPHSAPVAGNSISREVGEFHGASGHHYTLIVTFTREASALAAAHPRLKVATSGIARSDLEAAGVLAFSASFICILFGLTLLGVAILGSSTSPGRVRIF